LKGEIFHLCSFATGQNWIKERNKPLASYFCGYIHGLMSLQLALAAACQELERQLALRERHIPQLAPSVRLQTKQNKNDDEGKGQVEINKIERK
jgi:hypothetical protein